MGKTLVFAYSTQEIDDADDEDLTAELERVESEEKGVGEWVLSSEKKHVTKLKTILDQEVKKGADNSEGIKLARIKLNAAIEKFETKYSVHIYFDSNGVMKEVKEPNPSLSDPPGNTTQDRDQNKTLVEVLNKEAEEAPWWNEECLGADAAFREAQEAHGSNEEHFPHIRSL